MEIRKDLQATEKLILWSMTSDDLTETKSCLEKADVVYGDQILKNGNLFRYKKADALENIRFALPFCHQSTLTSKELFKKEIAPTCKVSAISFLTILRSNPINLVLSISFCQGYHPHISQYLSITQVEDLICDPETLLYL